MRRTVVLATLLASSGCFQPGDDDGPPPPPPSTAECDPNGLCTNAHDPLVIGGISNPHLGVGTTLVVPFAKHSTLASFTIDASTSGVVDAKVAGDVIEIDARGAGSTVLAFRDPSGAVLATLELTAIDIATISFHVRTVPVAPSALSSLAGLAGSTDSVAIAYRSTAGEVLAGSGEISLSGTGRALEPSVEPLLSEDFRLVSHRVGLRFAQAGNASLAVALADGRSATLPIQIVAAPDTIAITLLTLDANGDLIAAPASVASGGYVGADVVGRTASGTLIAGVTAAWTTNPPISAVVGAGTSRELVWTMPGATMTISATTGTLTATAVISGR